MKYSTFKYGGGAAGAKYGTEDSVEYLTWYFGVFWDDAFVDESGLMNDLQVDRGRDHLLSTGGGWERFRAGEASGTFDNTDGRFDPYNTGSPLYGFLLPGRVVRITVTVLPPYAEVSTTYDVMRGIIDDIQTGGVRDGKREARIIVKDGLEWLARRSIALALVQDTQALVTAAAIATQVDFDDVDDWSIAQLGTDSVEVFVAFGNDNSAINLINQFVDAEAGQVFHSKSGVLTFVTNDYTQLDTTDIDDALGHITRDFELKAPWEVVRTRSKITVNPYVEGSAESLWSFGVSGTAAWDAALVGSFPTEPYLYDNNDIATPITIDAIFSTGGPAASPVVTYEAVGGDFSPPSNTWEIIRPGGTYESLFILTTTDIGIGLRLSWAKTGTILSTYDGSVVNYVEITANPLVPSDSADFIASDSAAIVIYGEKTFELDNSFIQDATYAQAYANYVVAELKDAHLFPTIIIERRASLQFSPELYVSKIHLTIPALGIDDTFRVGKISHRWLNQNGFATQTLLRLEPVLGVL